MVSTLIKLLSARGYHIATVKHAPHGYDMDIPGKDSWLHFQAGARKVVLAGPDSITIHERSDFELPLINILDRLRNGNDLDCIFIEGYKNEPGPKVQIIRDLEDVPPDGDIDLIAVVSEFSTRQGCLHFSPFELDKLADFLENQYLKPLASV